MTDIQFQHVAQRLKSHKKKEKVNNNGEKIDNNFLYGINMGFAIR